MIVTRQGTRAELTHHNDWQTGISIGDTYQLIQPENMGGDRFAYIDGEQFTIRDDHFVIPVCNVSHFEKKLARIQRKADKLGCPAIDVELVEVHRIERVEKQGAATIRIDKTFNEYKITGEAPKLAGFEFIGKIEHQHSEPVLNSAPGQKIPAEYENAAPVCNHCNTSRYRKQNFVFKNIETGDHILVGRNCLADYFDGHDPKAAAKWSEYIQELREYDPDLPCNWGDNKNENDPVLSVAAAAVRVYGWTSATAARKYNETIDEDSDHFLASTASRVAEQLTAIKNKDKKKIDQALIPEDQDVEFYKAAAAWIQEQPREDDNDYIRNLQIILKDGYHLAREFGLLVSVCGSYQRHLEREANIKHEKKAAATSEYFGEIKKRDVFTLTLQSVTAVGGFYGTTLIHRFLDQKGNAAVWFASTDPELENGKTYEIKATVTAHDEYKESKQTKINRAAIIREIEQKTLDKAADCA